MRRHAWADHYGDCMTTVPVSRLLAYGPAALFDPEALPAAVCTNVDEHIFGFNVAGTTHRFAFDEDDTDCFDGSDRREWRLEVDLPTSDALLKIRYPFLACGTFIWSDDPEPEGNSLRLISTSFGARVEFETYWRHEGVDPKGGWWPVLLDRRPRLRRRGVDQRVDQRPRDVEAKPLRLSEVARRVDFEQVRTTAGVEQDIDAA